MIQRFNCAFIKATADNALERGTYSLKGAQEKKEKLSEILGNFETRSITLNMLAACCNENILK